MDKLIVVDSDTEGVSVVEIDGRGETMTVGDTLNV